jgi:hypothetical protein
MPVRELGTELRRCDDRCWFRALADDLEHARVHMDVAPAQPVELAGPQAGEESEHQEHPVALRCKFVDSGHA